MRHLFAACFLLTGCLLLTTRVAATAQDAVPTQASAPGSPEPGVTVEGAGTAKLPADTLEFRGVLSIGGTALADVMLEYDRATTRMSKALEQMGAKGLACEMRGARITAMSDDAFRKRQQQAMQQWWAQQQGPVQKCSIKDFVTLRAPLDGLSAKEVAGLVVSILDLAAELDLKDPTDSSPRNDPWGRPIPSDLPEGWTPGMSFLLRDTNALYAAASKEALKDARTKADVQAGLAGGTRGNLVGIDTVSGGSVEPGKARDLQHTVVLRVRYELTRNN